MLKNILGYLILIIIITGNIYNIYKKAKEFLCVLKSSDHKSVLRDQVFIKKSLACVGHTIFVISFTVFLITELFGDVNEVTFFMYAFIWFVSILLLIWGSSSKKL